MRRLAFKPCAVATVFLLIGLPAALQAQAPAETSAISGQQLAATTAYRILGWNNLGMHCMDSDYSVFSILPPYNTIHAQVIKSGKLVTSSAGLSVKYQAVVDPAGSINRTSAYKTNFWQFVLPLYGAQLPVNVGLTKIKMPGPANTPQAMLFDAPSSWYVGEGIPITPKDDAGRKNTYPMMRLIARTSAGAVLAKTDIVLPVSDEMDCRACHASGSGPAARPVAGWVYDPNPERDFRLNILLLHDEDQKSDPAYSAALAAKGYDRNGLFAQAKRSPILCANCHSSNALPGTGLAGILPLTQSVHAHHAFVFDPTNGQTLESNANRSSCYRCHPGAQTRCLRGAMGSAIALDGTQTMQCQDCHGSMTAVGSSRQGWLDEPACQNCHTGTATSNNGEIRYTSVFDSPGHRRVPVNPTFATNANSPAPGLSLYRFSSGHGNLMCEACHGATHAEYPSSHANDNVQSMQLQGHVGVISECSSCHTSPPRTITGGPHGLHPVGSAWVSSHGDAAEEHASQCQACHGADYRGSVLSRSQADRTLSTEFGSRFFWRGFQISCYACHNGPDGEDATPNHPPVVSNLATSTKTGKSVTATVAATDVDGQSLTLRVVSQPSHGRAGILGKQVTYYPDTGFVGLDSFTLAAWDGFTNSNLGKATVKVTR